MKPMLDPKHDLKGATPEKLARAILKPLRRQLARAEAVFGYELPVQNLGPVMKKACMRLVMGGINGHYLRNITENYAHDTEEVLAAVAYATHASLLFDWCWKHQIPLKFYGRLDDTIPVTRSTSSRPFSARDPLTSSAASFNITMPKSSGGVASEHTLAQANLTDSAWHKNIEAGCFFPETEING